MRWGFQRVVDLNTVRYVYAQQRHFSSLVRLNFEHRKFALLLNMKKIISEFLIRIILASIFRKLTLMRYTGQALRIVWAIAMNYDCTVVSLSLFGN